MILAFAFFISPYSCALLKSKSHFIKHTKNEIVLYEPGVEEYANSIASYFQRQLNVLKRFINFLSNTRLRFIFAIHRKALMNSQQTHQLSR